MKKNIILIGGHNKAKSLALSLTNQGHHVVYIGDDYSACEELRAIEEITVIHGDGTKPYILDEAGAADCDFSIAMSPKDEDNLVASQICKKEFNVKKTVSLLSDPRKTEFFYQMGVDKVVCATQAITSIIEQQAFIDEMTNIVPIAKGHAQIVEVRIPTDSPVDGKKLWEIDLPKEVVIGCILRGETTIIPRGDTRICAGDNLVVISVNGQEMAAIKELTGR